MDYTTNENVVLLMADALTILVLLTDHLTFAHYVGSGEYGRLGDDANPKRKDKGSVDTDQSWHRVYIGKAMPPHIDLRPGRFEAGKSTTSERIVS